MFGNRAAWLIVMVSMLVSWSSAQSSVWSGLAFGLPEEAAGIALYVVDVETAAKAATQPNAALPHVRTVSVRVSSGELNEDGTFSVKANVDAALAAGEAVPARRFLILFQVVMGTLLEVTPNDAELSLAFLGIEDEQGELIGLLEARFPSDDLTTFPFPLIAHQPTLIEGSSTPPELEGGQLVFDMTMPEGFNLLKSEQRTNLVDAQVTFSTDPNAPQEWLYQSHTTP